MATPWKSGPRFGGLTITPRHGSSGPGEEMPIAIGSRVACGGLPGRHSQRLAQRGSRGLDDGGRAFGDRRGVCDPARGACRRRARQRPGSGCHPGQGRERASSTAVGPRRAWEWIGILPKALAPPITVEAGATLSRRDRGGHEATPAVRRGSSRGRRGACRRRARSSRGRRGMPDLAIGHAAAPAPIRRIGAGPRV